MAGDEERIVPNPGRMADIHREAGPLSTVTPPGRQLLQGQVRKNFRIYAKKQEEADPARWHALNGDEQFAEFKQSHHAMLAVAKERGWGQFGRE